jgi:hypothetical protein
LTTTGAAGATHNLDPRTAALEGAADNAANTTAMTVAKDAFISGSHPIRRLIRSSGASFDPKLTLH